MRRIEHTDKIFFEGNVDLSPIAASLNRIFKTVENNGLGQETFIELDKEIQTVSSKFGISRNAAVLLGCIAEHNTSNGCDDDNLAEYVGCSNIEFIGFRPALEELENRGVVSRMQRVPRSRSCYFVTREALKAVADDAEFIPFPMTGLSADELFTRFRIFFSDFQKNVIDSERLLANIHQVLLGNQELEFSRKVLNSSLITECSDTEERFFFYLCHRLVSYGDNAVPIEILLQFNDYMEDDQLIRRTLSNGNSALQKSGLVCFGGENGFQDMDSLALSEDVIGSFFNEVTLERKSERRHKDIISSGSIIAKELYYNEKETEQMERLASLLSPQNFKGVQQRLKDMGMRKGFAVLFSGGAGCGKTAGAYELARRSRGTPRLANRLLKRVRDFAQVKYDGIITYEVAAFALDLLEVDKLGLDQNDRNILLTIMDKFDGGPVGLDTLAATVGEEAVTIEDVYEPYLMQIGFLNRTPRGRCVTALAYEHLGLPLPGPGGRPEENASGQISVFGEE